MFQISAQSCQIKQNDDSVVVQILGVKIGSGFGGLIFDFIGKTHASTEEILHFWFEVIIIGAVYPP